MVLSLVLLPAAAAAETIAGPVRVIDGDTVDVGETRVRLHGIDAAEDDQTCEPAPGVAWRCGAWVTDEVRALFEGREASCERVDTDRYGRAVARCVVGGMDAIAVAKEGPGGVDLAGAEADTVDMGAEIVARGLALAYRRYSKDYVLLEAEARARRVGVFGAALEDPAIHRRRGDGRAPPRADCPVKGNVSDNGRIFHAPGQAFYDRTSIDEAKGERWFCSAEEARAAGWRAARR